jgi:hypothetical protein
MAIGSFSSGNVLAAFGWGAVNQIVLPVVLIALCLLGWYMLRGRTQPA